jgi:PAS domain-containing protein
MVRDVLTPLCSEDRTLRSSSPPTCANPPPSTRSSPQISTARLCSGTEEIRLTDELRDPQYHTRSLIESNVDALMMTDPLGIVTDVNQNMEARTGLPCDELIGPQLKKYFTDLAAEAGGQRAYNRGLIEASLDGLITVDPITLTVER